MLNAGIMTVEEFEDMISKKAVCACDFSASWCGPCRMISPIIEDLANELYGKVKVGKVNVDEEMELAVKYQVESIPTLLLFKDGKVVNKLIGLNEKEEIISKFNLK